MFVLLSLDKCRTIGFTSTTDWVMDRISGRLCYDPTMEADTEDFNRSQKEEVSTTYTIRFKASCHGKIYYLERRSDKIWEV